MCKGPRKGGVAPSGRRGVCDRLAVLLRNKVSAECCVQEKRKAGLMAHRKLGQITASSGRAGGGRKKGVGWRRGGRDRILTSRRRLYGLWNGSRRQSGSETFEGGPPALPPKRQRPFQGRDTLQVGSLASRGARRGAGVLAKSVPVPPNLERRPAPCSCQHLAFRVTL